MLRILFRSKIIRHVCCKGNTYLDSEKVYGKAVLYSPDSARSQSRQDQPEDREKVSSNLEIRFLRSPLRVGLLEC